ncbi:AFG1-like ATPase-domain-containing protein [Coniella lustricola]|uniref:AFG1-like ATPase-domain-containing protein n=1 Tax=Coniella lustricola TaxID=2025994 RepID=A0A2T3AHG2_9PEZI|nr:AFG1-like ATPase-domain-containing protein [Coniella lustricola]
MNRLGTAVTITDPLVKYHTLIATGLFSPDPAQHRLARQLQKLYLSLRDYEPPAEYRSRLRQVTQALDGPAQQEASQLAVKSHPIRRNPLFARFFQPRQSANDHLALTRVLTSHQAALDIDSPKGLFLSGEVGTGKSMLLDLLADGLPTSKKRRWHFNTFMLYSISRLEKFRKLHPELSSADGEWSLLWLAKEMIEQSPILFLDEFQLPDRASSKILSNLFIPFFQLGGVLIASSNRMPDELEKAVGAQYPASGTEGGLVRQLMGARGHPRGELYGGTSDFAAFLEVLKARCDFWHMEGAKDWRRRDLFEDTGATEQPLGNEAGMTSSEAQDSPLLLKEDVGDSTTPRKYALTVDSHETWHRMMLDMTQSPLLTSIPWQPAAYVVYGRAVKVPRQHNGVVFWDFHELVQSFGPADYITLASHFHTFIIDKVPVLPVSMKNEARRFITLLDALYEARCKLLIRAEVGPDNLFFPEQSRQPSGKGGLASVTRIITRTAAADSGDHEDATYSETVAEVYQDSAAPFRPNISTYTDEPKPRPRISSIHAEIDSDFGPSGQKVDFVNIAAFTGEDERFAYKRAASRLWEMCSASWHARPGAPESWWTPLPVEARHWEGKEPTRPLGKEYAMGGRDAPSDVAWGPSQDLDEPAGLSKLRVEDLRREMRE